MKNVDVRGCKPPWYLAWFKSWKKLLNNGVQVGDRQFPI